MYTPLSHHFYPSRPMSLLGILWPLHLLIRLKMWTAPLVMICPDPMPSLSFGSATLAVTGSLCLFPWPLWIHLSFSLLWHGLRPDWAIFYPSPPSQCSPPDPIRAHDIMRIQVQTISPESDFSKVRLSLVSSLWGSECRRSVPNCTSRTWGQGMNP